MCGYFSDYERPDPNKARYPEVPTEPMKLCEAAVWCIAEGSEFPSCFLHFTSSLEVAVWWRNKGRKERKDMKNYLVRLNPADIDPTRIIDCSTQKALSRWLQRTSGGKYIEEDRIMDAIHNYHKSAALRCEDKREVLIKARGDFPYRVLKIGSRDNLL